MDAITPKSQGAKDLSTGRLARLGLLSNDEETQSITFLNTLPDIETLRVSFADPHGVLRGKTITRNAIRSVLCDGITVPSSLLLKDTSHQTVFPVWERDAGFGLGKFTGAGDIILKPDVSTFMCLPWTQNTGWILCDIYQADGSEISFASRTILKNALSELGKSGLEMKIGLEVEFHIFKEFQTENGQEPPRYRPLTSGMELLSEARLDQLEFITEPLRKACQALKMPLISIEHEFGPSQLEFVFAHDDPLIQADRLVLFRSMVKQICKRQGLHATFMTKPHIAASAASGWHIHQSILDKNTGQNLFSPSHDGALSEHANAWIAGILKNAAACCLMTSPTVNGYQRYQSFKLAPDRIQWARDNKGAMLRALLGEDDPSSRLENRVAEPAANPYFALSSQIASGLNGLKNKLDAPDAVETPYASQAPLLPINLAKAIESFGENQMLKDFFGSEFVDYLTTLKSAEWRRACENDDEKEAWELQEYFELF